MSNKLNKEGNSYFITKTRRFEGEIISEENLIKAFDFSKEMVFGEGHNKAHRSGGSYVRNKVEKFTNTFQGKLAEFIFRETLLDLGFKNVSEIDVGVYGKGKWDDTDVISNDTKFNVKSAAHFSNLLLLEEKDWTENGEYKPNLSIGSTSIYDYFVLVRIKPDLKNVLSKNGMLYKSKVNIAFLKEIILNEDWYYDFGGVCSHNTLLHIIKNNYMLPKGSLLNGRVKMDADNYYIQCGSLKSFDEFVKEYKDKINAFV